MPEYLSPGVYVEEIDAGPKPIEGVSTSTAGAVGVTEKGPSDGRPLLVTSFAEFQRNFGGLLPDPEPGLVTKWQDLGGVFWRFPLAVKGFFDNGGQRLYIRRVVASGAIAAKAELKQGLFLDLRKASKKGDTVIELSRVSQLIGLGAGTSVLLVRTDGATPQGPFTVASYDAAAGDITLDKALDEDIAPGSWAVQIIAYDDTKASLTFTAYSQGEWGNKLRVRLRPMVSASLRLLAAPEGGGSTPTTSKLTETTAKGDKGIKLANAAAFSDKDKVVILGRTYNLKKGAGDTFEIAPPAKEELPKDTPVQRLRRVAAPNAKKVLYIATASNLYEGALLELDNGDTKFLATVKGLQGSKIEIEEDLPDTFFEDSVARLIEARCEVQYQPSPDQPVEVELFENLHLVDNESPSYLVTRINQSSRLVRVKADPAWLALQPSLDSFPASRNGAWASLGGGDNKFDTLIPDDFVGKDLGPGQRSGIPALEDIDEISICMVPGIWNQDVRSALITHCESLKDRFAIVDPPPADLLDLKVRLDPETIKGPVDTKYAAIYYPWLKGRDFLSRRDVLLPPSGHVAGIYARTDVERGVHKAPANEVVRGISSFEIDITKREQDILNPKGVNALRYFPGRGLRVWGARTMSSDGSWKYINVRRLFIFVEESIDEGTQWVVFEPNDERLWARVRATINQFLDRLWREGSLQGETRNEAYFVKCDRTTMSQDDIDNGKLICLIGIAPVKPAEFVIFRIQQKTLDQKA